MPIVQKGKNHGSIGQSSEELDAQRDTGSDREVHSPRRDRVPGKGKVAAEVPPLCLSIQDSVEAPPVGHTLIEENLEVCDKCRNDVVRAKVRTIEVEALQRAPSSEAFTSGVQAREICRRQRSRCRSRDLARSGSR